MSPAEARPTATGPVDLSNCDREPIHIPGAIQPHGLLLALREPELRIVQATVNALDLIGVAHEAVLNAPLESLLEAASLAAVREALSAPDPRAVSPIRLTSLPQLGGLRFDGILHRSGGLALLELEPAEAEGGLSFADFYRRVRGAFSRLQKAARVVEMCNLAAEELAKLTGFDRVMAYRFDRDGHGHVIAEVKRDGLESYLDLHYPASDIPAQARRLYALNWLRLIVDVDYRPAPLAPDLNPLTGEPLDLSAAVLRSVSPIHCEYLHNMGIHGSMSVSLVVDGQLWGLLICHHYAPRFVPYEVRTACEFLGQALSWQVAARERAEAFERRASVQQTLARLIDQLAGGGELAAALSSDPSALLQLVDAAGAAVRVSGVWTCIGTTPSSEELDALVTPLWAGLRDGILASEALVELWPDARRYDAVASGVLAVALAPEHGDLIAWFRPEVVQTVNWAGDPQKKVSLADGDARLTPRGSFALWRETVRSRSLPWQPWEVDAAADLRRAIVGHLLRRNAELSGLNNKLSSLSRALERARLELEDKVVERTLELSLARDELVRHADELKRSNDELERFAYVASHDLQEPLRMVVSYVQLLARRYKGKLDSDADEFIEYAVDGAKRMQTLINDLLAYSRVGRQERPMVTVDLEVLFTNALQNLTVAIAESAAEITHDPLPKVVGDRQELGQVLQNLLSNALKFKAEAPARVHVGASHGADGWTFSVRDQGIGIAPEHIGRIFVVFQRLHTRVEYPGSGVGLAISKKIIERHGGRIWVESAAGAGSTFFFTLPDRKLEVRT